MLPMMAYRVQELFFLTEFDFYVHYFCLFFVPDGRLTQMRDDERAEKQ